MLFRIGHSVRQPVLSLLGSSELLPGLSLCIGVEIPGLDLLFDRFVFVVVRNAEQLQDSLAGHRFLVERVGLEPCFDGVARTVMASIDPREHLEGLAGHQHFPCADNRPPRFVDHFGGNRILMIGIAVQFLGGQRIDLDLDRAVGTDRNFVFDDDFGRLLGPAPPGGNRS